MASGNVGLDWQTFSVKPTANMNCVKNQTNFDLFYGLAEQ